MRQSRLITPSEDEFIIAHYGDMLVKDIAAALGWPSWQAVQWRAIVLERQGRLDRKRRAYHRPWSDDDDEFLADHWGLWTDQAIAEHLGRTVVACVIRAKRKLNISRKMAFWTSRNVAQLFGVDDHLVVKWIKAKVLRGRKSLVRCGDGNIAWRIDDKDLTAFIQRYPYHYDRRRVEQGTWWRRLAEQAWARDPWLTAAEAAAQLGVGTETVRRHLRRGWLPGERTWEAGAGGGWRVAKSALSTFRRRKEPSTVTPALLAWYGRYRRAREATG